MITIGQALPIWRALGDRGREAQTLSGIGWTYYGLGELQKALQYYNLALPIRRDLNDLRGQAQTLTTIGQIYRVTGEPQKAINYFGQALPLARQSGDKNQEAFALDSFAFLYEELDEFEKAIDYFEQGLSLFREIGQLYGEAEALNGLGIVYNDLGDFEKSFEYFQQALSLDRRTGNRLGESDVLNNISIIYQSQHSLGQALDYLSRALTIKTAIGEKIGQAAALNNLGLVNEELGERDRALDFYRRAEVHRSGKSLHDSEYCRELLSARRRPTRRCNMRCVRRRFLGKEATKPGKLRILSTLALIRMSQGKLDEALENSQAAVETFETMRTNISAPERRASLQGFNESYYSLLIEILSKLQSQRPSAGFDAAALEISERARARGLLDLLREARVDIREHVDPALLDHERTLLRELNSKDQYRTRLLGNKSADTVRAELEKEISVLLTDYEKTRAKIRASSPEYAALTQPDTLRTKEIQQTVLDDNSILLEYYLGPESFFWAVTPTSINMYKLPPRQEIERVARQVYDSLIARNLHPSDETPEQRTVRLNNADAQYNEASAKLSEMLLGPVVDKLVKKRLLLVTDGILQYIPFSALPLPQPIAGKTSVNPLNRS